MVNIILSYLVGYVVGMFITRHIFLKVVKEVYLYGHSRGVDVGINLLRDNGFNEAANFLEKRRREAK